jgi:hypothetical protein
VAGNDQRSPSHDIFALKTGWDGVALDLALLGIASALGWLWKLRVDFRFLAATAAIWVVWLMRGFHYNLNEVGPMNWEWEILNVSAKTAWGLAYLWPLTKEALGAWRTGHFIRVFLSPKLRPAAVRAPGD